MIICLVWKLKAFHEQEKYQDCQVKMPLDKKTSFGFFHIELEIKAMFEQLQIMAKV